MTSYTTKAAYPYPDPTDPVTDYPATANTFASYIDNLPNRNVIINGQFDIWQRGTSFTTPTNGSYTADRWRIGFDGTGGTRSVTMNANVGAPLTGGIQQWRTLILSQAIAGTGQTSLTLSQRIENARTFAAETVTASAYIWGDTRTITVKLIQNFGTGGSPSSPVTTTLGTFAVTSVRNRMKLTGTIPTAVNKTFGTNGDDYLELVFEVGGSTSISGITFWGVQLEQNSTATALERRPIQQELALCQRYYVRIEGQYYNPFAHGVQIDASNNIRCFCPTPVVMRGSPIATVTGTMVGIGATAGYNLTAPGNPGYTAQGNGIMFTTTGAAGAPGIGHYSITLGAGGPFQISAEL